MKPRKFVLIGAGSSAFTAALLGGIVRTPQFRGSTVGLVDIDTEILDLTAKLARRLSEERGAELTVEASPDRREVLPGATYVTVTVAAGGTEAWRHDLEIPAQYDLIQTVGDTVGPGGLARGLRHVPILVGLARDMEELCPEAWLFNYTNPMSLLCRAVTRETKVKCVGLCIGVELIRRYLAGILGVPLAETKIWAGGINHCVWALHFTWREWDAYPLVEARLRELAGEEKGALARTAANFPGFTEVAQPGGSLQPFCYDLYRRVGYYPGPGDTHVSEFFPHLLGRPEDREKYGLHLFPIEQRLARRDEFRERLRAQAEGKEPLDWELFGPRGTGEEAQVLEIVKALEGNTDAVFHLNVPNRGYITNLPDEVVVEVPALMGAYGCRPVPLGNLPWAVAGVIAHWCATQELTVDAALTGDRTLARRALLSDLSTFNLDLADRMLEELLEAHREHLPQFWEEEPRGAAGGITKHDTA